MLYLSFPCYFFLFAALPTVKCRCRFFQVKEILLFSWTESRKPRCQWWVGLLVFSHLNNIGNLDKKIWWYHILLQFIQEFNFHTEKRVQHNPPSELFSKVWIHADLFSCSLHIFFLTAISFKLIQRYFALRVLHLISIVTVYKRYLILLFSFILLS